MFKSWIRFEIEMISQNEDSSEKSPDILYARIKSCECFDLCEKKNLREKHVHCDNCMRCFAENHLSLKCELLKKEETMSKCESLSLKVVEKKCLELQYYIPFSIKSNRYPLKFVKLCILFWSHQQVNHIQFIIQNKSKMRNILLKPTPNHPPHIHTHTHQPLLCSLL